MGFLPPTREIATTLTVDLVRAEVIRIFNPEFLNRLDETIVFNSLTDEDLIQIIQLMITQINQSLANKQISITLTPEAERWILQKTCHDRSYGARPLRRALQKYIEDPLAEALIQGAVTRPAFLEVFLEGEGLYYRQVDSENQPAPLFVGQT